jgi:hypothetical protein
MKKTLFSVLACCAGLAAPLLGQSTTDQEVSSQFVTFAGSPANALALVSGLRNGTPVLLTDANGQTTSFTPISGPLGYGNAVVALSLAQQNLAQLGIASPNPQQIAAELNGGVLSTAAGPSGTTITAGTPTGTSAPGILRLRAAGQGWGAIATRVGANLGTAVNTWGVTQQQLALAGQLNGADQVTAAGTAQNAVNGTGAGAPGGANGVTNPQGATPQATNPGSFAAPGASHAPVLINPANPGTAGAVNPAPRATAPGMNPPPSSAVVPGGR